MNRTQHPTGRMALAIAIVALACSVAAVILALASFTTAREARDSTPFIVGSEAREEAGRKANRFRSATQARQMAMGILAYASNHDGEAPEQDAWRRILIDEDMATSDMFTLRGSADVEHAYHYIRPTPQQVRTMQESGTSGVVVIYEDPGLWHGEGGHVTYLDTTTEWIEGDAFGELVEELRTED